VFLTWRHNWLLSYYTFALNMPNVPVAVRNYPMSTNKLDSAVAVIFQAHPVSKYVLVLFNIGFAIQEEAFNGNFNSLGVR
jgi:hypothetical protein